MIGYRMPGQTKHPRLILWAHGRQHPVTLPKLGTPSSRFLAACNQASPWAPSINLRHGIYFSKQVQIDGQAS